MDFFFTTSQRYTVYDSIANVRNDIKSVIERRPFDFSTNLTGRFLNETDFTVSPKWSFSFIRWLETDLTYLRGKLTYEAPKTLIVITVRPNSVFVIGFYFSMILAILEPLGISTFSKENTLVKFWFFPLFATIILAQIIFSTSRIKRRFEKLLSLNPEK